MLTNQIKLDNFTYCSVEILPIIFGHFKYNYVWIRDVVDLPEKRKKNRLIWNLKTCKSPTKEKNIEKIDKNQR